jgi:poly[(R)-3-hydroxyalkanoate] polymerase subunit PhaC
MVICSVCSPMPSLASPGRACRASGMSSRQEVIRRVLSERPEPTVALNPLTGVHIDDLKQIAGRTALQGARQPLILGKHLSSYARKLVEIVANDSRYTPDKHDTRFRDTAWQDSGFYKGLMQSYLALNETLQEWVDDLELEEVDRLRAEFLLRVVGESIAPPNTLLGNPQALRKARETRGGSLLKGMRNLIGDLRENHGIPSQVKDDVFVVGENLATSPGKVVFANEVLELIQYAPATGQVYRRPMLMVSAMINKFYALDLTPDRSFIKYCVDNSLQLFVVSWANPTIENANWGVEKYALAVMEAISAVKSISNCKDLNLFSLCSGAMITSAMAACLEARSDNCVHSMTVGVCMLEMEPQDMELSAFSSPQVFERVKNRSREAGILHGHELASSMLWMRPQDLIWGNVANNYLLGNDPPEFDLLYWNNDWTNLPAQLHGDVIDIFSTGCLSTPRMMEIDGTPLDLKAVNCDKFFLGGLSDHITPWKACYRAAQAFGGDKQFLLSNSGHMQTMLNSPSKKRSSFFMNKKLPGEADEWLQGAELQEGSWWPYWLDWIQSRSLNQKRAPKKLGSMTYPASIAAPGSFVHQQS